MLFAERLTAACACLAPRLVLEVKTNGAEIEVDILRFERDAVVDVAGVKFSYTGDADRFIACATARATSHAADATTWTLVEGLELVRSLLLIASLRTVGDFSEVFRDPSRLAAALQRVAVIHWAGVDAPDLYPLTQDGRALLTPALFRALVGAATAEQVVGWMEAWGDDDPFAEHALPGRALSLAAWEMFAGRLSGDFRRRALSVIDAIPDEARSRPDLVRTLVGG